MPVCVTIRKRSAARNAPILLSVFLFVDKDCGKIGHMAFTYTADYLRVLQLTLFHANSLMFIDPHLDPSKPSYHDFVQLLLATRR